MAEEEEWKVRLSDDAEKDLERLIRGLGTRRVEKLMAKVMRTLRELDRNWHKVKPIRGLKNAYRIREGKLRVAFWLVKEKKEVEVFSIGFREAFYKKL